VQNVLVMETGDIAGCTRDGHGPGSDLEFGYIFLHSDSDLSFREKPDPVYTI